MHTLNLGILAHVDAGKTTLTERLLYTAGAIDALGSVDEGTTQTDSLTLERQRGITIRAAVVAFTVGDLTVNIIDTPGHPDFIAEVERSLAVLDGAVLVLSAVEGVQSQTIVLMRALQRLRVPTVLFVNKIDRVGADPDRVIEAVHMRLTRDALVVEEFDSELTADLVAETAAGRAHPTCFGSAATGAGIDALIDVITTYLPVAGTENDAPASGLVFKVERAAAGEKVAYVRMFDGSVRVRERLHFEDGRDATITGLKVFEHGAAVDRPVVGAGQIAKLAGLRSIRTGDAIGSPPRRATQVFAPPMFEVAVVAHDVGQTAAMHAALVQLAEQDPMIGLRQDRERNETFVSLYGEVQQEVIQQTLRGRARHRGRLPRPDDDLHRAPARRRDARTSGWVSRRIRTSRPSASASSPPNPERASRSRSKWISCRSRSTSTRRSTRSASRCSTTCPQGHAARADGVCRTSP